MKGFPRSWSNTQILEISNLLKRCNITLPLDIHRSIRSLDHINFFKGTEFRTVLLYIGIVVFKDFLQPSVYQMFLNLFCAVTICSTNTYAPFVPKARDLFNEFIENHINEHGEDSIVSNIHLLNHVVDDVEHFGELNTRPMLPH